MSTPLANKTTFSSRMKMASALTSTKSTINHSHNNNISVLPKTNGATSKLPPRTSVKPANNRLNSENKQHLAATSSRIAPPRSRISQSSVHSNTSNSNTTTASRFGNLMAPTAATLQRTANVVPPLSRQSSRMSSNSSAVNSMTISNNISKANFRTNSNLTSRQNSLASTTSAHVATVRKAPVATAKSSHIPDTVAIRKGLAKFQNPIECQRQFQALSSEIRQLNEVISNKDRQIFSLQEQRDGMVKTGLGYATVVQYFARKLRIDTEGLDLETECHQLKLRVEELLKNESEYESRLETAVEKHKIQTRLEQDLRKSVERELEETKERQSKEITNLLDAHKNTLNDLNEQHETLKQELETRISYLETELDSTTKQLNELKKEHEFLSEKYDKLEDSLTKDKDARVKFVQDKANQLQKEVESLNSVLEMRTERMHVLEKDSILLSEAQQELMTVKDINKTLKQQLESMEAALENKRQRYEVLFADSEKLAQELKRERKERRRMTMRTEQLEYALNESFTTENNITFDSHVEIKDQSPVTGGTSCER